MNNMHPVRIQRQKSASWWNKALFDRMPEFVNAITDFPSASGGRTEIQLTLEVPVGYDLTVCRDTVQIMLENIAWAVEIARPDGTTRICVATDFTDYGSAVHDCKGSIDILLQLRDRWDEHPPYDSRVKYIDNPGTGMTIDPK